MLCRHHSISLASSLGAAQPVLRVLHELRTHGPDAARRTLSLESLENPLLQELELRLSHHAGPRILFDGLWFSRPVGGITRVWDQILRFWQIPELFPESSPLLFINRGSCLPRSAYFHSLDGIKVDPLDFDAFDALAEENASIACDWGSDVFISSWISTSGALQPACSELAFVHDCMPERSNCSDVLKRLRLRWLHGARAHLSVSADTAADVSSLLNTSPESVPWCYPAPDPVFESTRSHSFTTDRWHRLCACEGLRGPFILLSGTSRVGSYKNPEVVLDALQLPPLEDVQLIISGVGAEQHANEFVHYAPSLESRIHPIGLSDIDLALMYRNALAVVIPSRIEGFGLPVVEVMAAGGIPLIADSRGLREAGAEAALCFSPDDSNHLASLISLLLDSSYSNWLKGKLLSRQLLRLRRLHPDLMGLAMLSQARRAASSAAP